MSGEDFKTIDESFSVPREIHDSELWFRRGGGQIEFFDTFNLRYPAYKEIINAIDDLISLSRLYSRFTTNTAEDNREPSRTELLTSLFADIIGDFAVSIKLASDGHIRQSMRSLRATLDLLIAGIYTYTSWTQASLSYPDGVNPFIEAFLSGLWGKLKDLNLDDIIIANLMTNSNGTEVSAREHLGKLTYELSKEFVDRMFPWENNEQPENIGIASKNIYSSLMKSLLEILSVRESKEHTKLLSQILDAENFIQTIIKGDKFTLKSCRGHEKIMMENLRKKLGLSSDSGSYLEEKMRRLTFVFESEVEGDLKNYPQCDECDKKATIFGILQKPDNKAMKKLIKYQLSKEDLEIFNKEIGKILNNNGKKEYFVDLIYSKLYTSLNDFVHSNYVNIPSVEEWYRSYFHPVLSVESIVLSRFSTRRQEKV